MNAGLPWGATLWNTHRYIPADERVCLATRPSPWFILFHAPGILTSLVLLGSLGVGWSILGPGALHAGLIATRFALACVVLLLVIGLARWLSRLYVVTERRIIIVAGVLSQSVGDVPLQRIQHATIYRSLLERILGLGTVGIATAGADGAAVRMLMVSRPARVVEVVRSPRSRPHDGIVVLGLAGAIGAGKSEVARVLSTLGCVVIDSDAQARAALERPDVRSSLVQWWGAGVLGADGRIDRSKVAEIVFADPAERSRLEQLVHPIVRTSRAEAIARARSTGSEAAVIDAPLLFEAGVDGECDAVIWVQASRRTRLDRVTRNRGWDEHELARREAAQWPVEKKRALCRYEIENDADERLDDRVRSVLDRALADAARRPDRRGEPDAPSDAGSRRT